MGSEAWAIGVDLGGTRVKVARVDADGKITSGLRGFPRRRGRFTQRPGEHLKPNYWRKSPWNTP
jgi:predicted NBD/HSP70 family sugar kinase